MKILFEFQCTHNMHFRHANVVLVERELEDHKKDDDGMYLKLFQSVDL